MPRLAALIAALLTACAAPPPAAPSAGAGGAGGEDEEADVARWKQAVGRHRFVRDVLPLDAFARCWVQELVLLRAIGAALPGDKRPAFERLAARGLRFNHYTTHPICSPARAALLTGRNAHSVGTGWLSNNNAGFPGYSGEMPLAAPTLAEALRAGGYATIGIGKELRTGSASENGDEVVVGTALMLIGENSRTVARAPGRRAVRAARRRCSWPSSAGATRWPRAAPRPLPCHDAVIGRCYGGGIFPCRGTP